MDHHQPGPALATMLHDFNPAQPFRTARSRTALGYVRNAFTNGRSLVILNHGWKRGSNHLVERFVAEVGTSASFFRIPGACQSELAGMRELIRLVGFDPRTLTVIELKKIFTDYLGFQYKRKRRTILILEDIGGQSNWVCDYVTELIEMDARSNAALMIVLMRQSNLDQLNDELALNSLVYRKAKHIALTPFTQAETRKFMRWRIDATDSADMGRIFDFQAITLIHELCEGMPDAIEHLGCASLELAESEDTAPVTTDIVMRASKNLPAPLLTKRPAAGSKLAAKAADRIPTLAPPEGPTIVLDYKGRTVRHLPVNKQRISIGRAVENDLCINSLYVSRQHATIFRNGPETAVVDLDSKNGTFVNSRRIRVQAISDQDEITIGYHTIRFLDPNAPRIRSLSGLRGVIPAVRNVRREPRVDEAANTSRARR